MSGRRASTSSAAATKPCWSRPREREATRLAILDAAHRLAELHGEAALTLSAVASEAGIARATIYGYFAGKSELLSQLSGEPPPEPEPPREIEPEPPHQTEPEPLREAEPAVEAAEDNPTPIPSEPDVPLQTEVAPPRDEMTVETGGESARPVAPEAPTDYDDIMRRQAEELDKLAKRLIVPKATSKEGTEGAVSRLDARLRVVEQTVTDMEGRHSRDAKEFSDRIDSTIEALQQRQTRLETSDDRLMLSLAELRLELHNLTSRMDEAGHEPAVRPAEHLEPVDFQPWKNSPEPETAEPIPAAPDNEQHDYLSSARRAAIDAAAAAKNESVGNSGQKTRWRWLFGAAIVVGAGLGILFNMRSDVAVQPNPVSQLVAHGSRQPANGAAEKRSVAALARAGNAEAQLIVGLKLLNGAGVPVNIQRAAGWLERAAENGQPVAQETLGVLYQTGTGVAVDMPKAMHWYEAAAHSGNVKAMSNLGKAYAGGWSEGTDYAKAVQWFSRAAAFGDVDAQFDLAILYERGEGTPRNLTDAYKWYVIAAKQGDRDASARAETIGAQLLPVYQRQARAAADGFKPSPAGRAANEIPALTFASTK